MAVKDKIKSKPNILSVSLRLVLIVLFAIGAYGIYKLSGAEQPGLISLVGIGVLLVCAAAVLIQLIVWGLIWVRNERVSELGLHIVRYAVTLTAVALCVFVLLSADYMELYSATHMNELRQNVISGSVYVQAVIGDGVQDDAQYFAQVQQAMDNLLLDTEENGIRHACLYLKTDAASTGSSGFAPAADGYLGYSTSTAIPCGAPTDVLESVTNRFEVEYRDSLNVGTYTLLSAYSPVFSINGEPVGVLEICEIKQMGAGIFRFATLELCLKLLALIAFFSFMFYGCMQLVDIVLRPRQFDRSRRVLSCGRESARPILFFITLSAALPVMMLLFAENIRSLMDVYQLPFGIGIYIPLVVYLLGIAIGQLFGRGHRATLSEIPADAGLLFSFLCNLALCLFMDWERLGGLGLGKNVIFILVLVFVCGLGYGIAYRITAKFQAQSDALFGYDKYAYLCSCLGAIAGIVLGALIIENYSNVTLRIISCILTAFTAVIAILLLEDLKSTVEIDESCKDTLTSYAGGIAGLVPAGLACCFNWIYLAEYMFENNISTAAIGFCVILPIVAFCFGNRLRLKHRAAQRISIAVSCCLSALAFVPMAFWPSFEMAVLSCVIICIAVIFAASGIYSTTRHGELKKLTFRAMPLLFVGIILAALALNIGSGMISLLAAAGVCLVFMAVFLISKYPSRPIIENKLPAITDGGREVKKPIFVLPVKKETKSIDSSADDISEQADKTDKNEKPEEDGQKDEKHVFIPVMIQESDDKAEEQITETPASGESEPEKKECSEESEELSELAAAAESGGEESAIGPSDKTSAEEQADENTEEESLPIMVIDDPEPESSPEMQEDNSMSETPENSAEPEIDTVSEVTEITQQSEGISAVDPEKSAASDESAEDDEVAAALARAAAAKRAKERWKRYSEMASKADDTSGSDGN